MLHTKDLQFSYKDGKSPVLSFPDIQCDTGEQWLLLGQSGSGKTTLLHLLAGLRTPTSGSVEINGTAIQNLSNQNLDRFRGQNIGVIFQQSHFVRSLSVQENLVLAQRLAGLNVDKAFIKEVLEHLNVDHKLNASTKQLSVGEQQRVNIARALVNRPTVILADEPTSALDDVNTDQVISLLQKEAAAANATLLIVTHDNRLKSIFDKQIEL
ncbi:MAG: ABC transporter ATP-binding protein [Bacteroidota bacterium]